MLDDLLTFFIEFIGNFWVILKSSIGNAIAIARRSLRRGGRI